MGFMVIIVPFLALKIVRRHVTMQMDFALVRQVGWDHFVTKVKYMTIVCFKPDIQSTFVKVLQKQKHLLFCKWKMFQGHVVHFCKGNHLLNHILFFHFEMFVITNICR